MSAAGTIQLGTLGIKKTLSNFSPTQAIFEYIWNGFDARAKTVNLTTKVARDGFDILESITISDDGDGIPHAELDKRFTPFLESMKAKQRGKYRNSETQGKEGRGRLTFFKFAQCAVWETRFSINSHTEQYEITIASDNLQKYDPTKPRQVKGVTGTTVKFTGINTDIGIEFINNELSEALKVEFGWFLKLNEAKGFTLILNGKPLEYKTLILAEEKLEVVYEATRTRFDVEFVQWQEKATDYSKFYFLDSNGFERFKQNTTFNNKGDGFNHSLFVKSRYFDDWTLTPTENDDQPEMNFGGDREPFNFLKEELAKFLRQQRKKVLRTVANEMIEAYDREQIFPKFGKSPYDKYRLEDLKEVIRTVYEADPRVFYKLNLQQKKTLVGFLNLLLDSDERDRVLTVLEHVIQLNEDEQKQLVQLLQTSELNQIIRTMTTIYRRGDFVFRHKPRPSRNTNIVQ